MLNTTYDRTDSFDIFTLATRSQPMPSKPQTKTFATAMAAENRIWPIALTRRTHMAGIMKPQRCAAKYMAEHPSKDV